MTTGIPSGNRLLHGLDQGPGVQRGQDDSVDPCRDRTLHELDLLDAIVSF